MGVTAVRAGGWVFLHIVENIETKREDVTSLQLRIPGRKDQSARCLHVGVTAVRAGGWVFLHIIENIETL